METITKEINAYFNGKYSFLKLLEVKYDGDENSCTVVFIFPESIGRLADHEEEEITKFVSGLLILQSVKLKVAFKKSFLDSDIVAKKVLQYFKETYASFSTGIKQQDINVQKVNAVINVEISLNKQQYGFYREHNISQPLNEFLLSQFCGEFELQPIISKTTEVGVQIAAERQNILASETSKELSTGKIIRYEVIDPVVLIGTDITPKPEFVQNITSNKLRVILAGTIENLQEKSYTAKRGKKDSKGEFPQKKYFSFVLKDPSAKIRCVHFCAKSNEKKLSKLSDGASILVLADVEVQDGKPSSCVVKEISFCTLKKDDCATQTTFDVQNHSYCVVFPKPYVSNIQVDIFAKKKVPNTYLSSNTFVVFDVETTGLEASKCEIIELGAAKVVNGIITETFQSLVCPKSYISNEITQITGITNAMVASSPKIDDVIRDFALFSANSVLVAHNMSFDIKFVQNAGRKFGIAFDNEKLDTLSFAKSKLYLTNYKLGTIVKELKIELTNAHRALFDAIATAEVLIKLNQESI